MTRGTMLRDVLRRKRNETAAGELISGSDSDGEDRRAPAKPRPKRRRILDPSAIATVQIYTNKVDSSLKIQPLSFQPVSLQDGEVEDVRVTLPVQKKLAAAECIELSDSEEEREKPRPEPQCTMRSPSPPPPSSSPLKACRRPNRKLMEINRKLDSIGSLLSPSPERAGLAPEQDQSFAEEDYGGEDDDDDDDDDLVIVDTQHKPRIRRPPPREPRQEARRIPLKFRCRTEIFRIPLLTTAPLKLAVEELSLQLKVPPSRLLLLRKEAELPVTSTVSELGLGIADIIDCVVISEDTHEQEDGNHGESDVITVRFQGKEKGSQQQYSVGKREPLGSVLTRYASQLLPALRDKTRFLFDGSKVSPAHTPFDLEMEDGDVIEVWF
ncbi:NFATC2-interacting protein isoform X1 [Alosa alosa]|uniref:NFATC2-interacting protein isoform X1 n=1 Tax=Alosa alosa TaxID=278164 RepID=UPI0020153DED|nr:NFATC2-interacting protein isoform X1 [Alosa alosa]